MNSFQNFCIQKYGHVVDFVSNRKLSQLRNEIINQLTNIYKIQWVEFSWTDREYCLVLLDACQKFFHNIASKKQIEEDIIRQSIDIFMFLYLSRYSPPEGEFVHSTVSQRPRVEYEKFVDSNAVMYNLNHPWKYLY